MPMKLTGVVLVMIPYVKLKANGFVKIEAVRVPKRSEVEFFNFSGTSLRNVQNE